jgi:hypothetical protein
MNRFACTNVCFGTTSKDPMKTALASLFVSMVALAQPFKNDVKNAVRFVDDAERAASQSPAPCPAAMADALDEIADTISALKRVAKPVEAEAMKQRLIQLASTSPTLGCRATVAQHLTKAIASLEEARVKMVRATTPVAPPIPPQPTAAVSALVIEEKVMFEKDFAAKLSVPEMSFTNMEGSAFSVGVRFRSLNGQFGEWTRTQEWSVPNQAYVWKNGFTHYFRYSSLIPVNSSNGQFVAQVVIFDSNSRILTTRETNFSARFAQSGPPVVIPNPPVVVLPAGPPARRECGIQNDPGCTMSRDGQWPMDATSFNGFMQALRANQNEILRVQMTENALAKSYITALQLGPILDSFQNEIFRIQVAQLAAGHVVNPQHALGLSVKFSNSIYQAQFTQLMTAQPVGTPSGNREHHGNGDHRDDRDTRDNRPPIPVGPPVYQGIIDCGTGPDAACQMRRGAFVPMDAQTFGSIWAALNANSNGFVQAQNVKEMTAQNGVTAAQLGKFMSLFDNQFTKLDIAKSLAPRVVNPQAAYGLAQQFDNDFIGQDFIKLMSAQR